MRAGFAEVTFAGSADFADVIFTDYASFSQANFTDNANFSRVTFTDVSAVGPVIQRPHGGCHLPVGQLRVVLGAAVENVRHCLPRRAGNRGHVHDADAPFL